MSLAQERIREVLKINARLAEYERQQAVLIEALETIAHSMAQARVLGNDVRREVRLSEETARAALAVVKPAGQEGGEA